MTEKHEQSERGLLLRRIENDEGTLEEQETWLARLEVLDPYFGASDYMLNLERMIFLKRKVQTLGEQLGTLLSREQLVALVQSIDYSEGSSENIDDLEARSMLFAASVPHPDADSLVAHVWADRDMSAEEVVEAALSWKVSDLFCLPGPIDSGWTAPSEPKTSES